MSKSMAAIKRCAWEKQGIKQKQKTYSKNDVNNHHKYPGDPCVLHPVDNR